MSKTRIKKILLAPFRIFAYAASNNMWGTLFCCFLVVFCIIACFTMGVPNALISSAIIFVFFIVFKILRRINWHWDNEDLSYRNKHEIELIKGLIAYLKED